MNRRDALAKTLGCALGLGAVGTAGTFGTSRAGESKSAKESGREFVELLTDARSATEFTDAPVADADLRAILQTGLNAPSALNLQPWFFSVVSDRKLLAEIDVAAGIKPGGRLYLTGTPTAIFVCADSEHYSQFDAGTASARMGAAALALGYGCKTVATPAAKANELYKERLGIPEKYDVFAVLLLGVEKTPSVDGASGATTRVPFDEKVVFVE